MKDTPLLPQTVACQEGATGTNIPQRTGSRGYTLGGHTGADIVDVRPPVVVHVLTPGLKIKQRAAHDSSRSMPL